MKYDISVYEPHLEAKRSSHMQHQKQGNVTNKRFRELAGQLLEKLEKLDEDDDETKQLEILSDLAGLAILRSAVIVSPEDPYDRLPRRPLGKLRPSIPRKHENVAPAIDWTPDRNTPGAFRVGHSNPPHIADGLTAYVELGGGAKAVMPNPMAIKHQSLGWSLTWSEPEDYALTAASVISSYQELLVTSINNKEANRRLALLRKAWRQLAKLCRE